MDFDWWRTYGAEACRVFGGERWTTSGESARRFGAQRVEIAGGQEGICDTRSRPRIVTGGNSGYSAVSMAIYAGARRVVLVGYDIGRSDGRSHWHGDHPGTLGNGTDAKYALWREQFGKLAAAAAARGIEIINASRATSLTCFPRMPIEEALHATEEAAAA